jgi:CRISPR-associated protein Cas2
MIYMICYDIAEPKRLIKVSKELLNYGIRTQYSFFQCDLYKTEFGVLMNKLRSIIDKDEDKLYVYPLCDKCIKKAMVQGTGKLIVIKSFEIL